MTKKGIKLVAPDNNGLLCYQGNCKLKINTLSKMLKVEPKNEAFNDISALFQWKFIQKKNLMFVFSENIFQDFVLIFANEETCKTVHDKIYKKRQKDSIEKEELQQRLLIPIFQKMSENVYSTRFKKVMLEWIERHGEKQKKELLELLKVHKNNHQILDVKNIKQELNTGVVRKRRFSEIDNTGENEEENIASKNKSSVNVKSKAARSKKKNKVISPEVKIIEESQFKFVNLKYQNCLRRKLLIFTSAQKSHCYEYNFYLTKQIFYHTCNNYQNGMKAILKVNEEGKECIKFENKQHICSPIPYDPQRYMELKIIKKPNYEILENCSSKSKRMLIIFDSNDRNKCYEYYCSHDKHFCCRGCASKEKKITAVIVHENTEFEYIILLIDEHVCQKRKYNPEKFNQVKKFVLSPNFEIQTNIRDDGRERKILIIFEGNNRKLCYTFYFHNSSNRYYCNGCVRKHKNVFAKLCQNDDGEEYVILSNFEHVCSLKKYIPQQNQIILRPPKFKYMEANEKYTSKLFIFDPNNLNLCYTFTKKCESSSIQYYCLGCRKSTKKMGKKVVAYLYKDDNDSQNSDGYYVKMADGQTHICKPQKYEAQKYEIQISKSKEDYILFREKQKDLLSLAVFDANDKTFCYKYFYQKSIKIFRCKECQKKKTHVTAKLHQDSDGNEYIISDQKKHLCKPIKVSSIINPNTLILENSGLIFDESKKKKIDESRIVRLPNFELQKNRFGVPERKLVILKSDDKNFCYEYQYGRGSFFCNKCKITANIHIDSENGENYIILSKSEHKCEPVKYQAEKKIIESSDFMVFNRDDDSKPTKLITFTSSEKTECYEYNFVQNSKSFRCCGCYSRKRIVCAKIMKDSDGQEYIQLLKNDHICSPKKFILEEFQPKTVPESGFLICSNQYGKANSKLIIFDPEKDGFGYEYYLENKNFFNCSKCERMKKRVTAKLFEKENGEKYLELSKEKHACESTKCEREKFNKKIIFNNFVVQFNTTGDPNSRLTIFDENDKTFGYQYSFYKSRNGFVCLECHKRSKATSAKLLIDANGKQSVEFGKNEHVCEIQNFKEKNIIFEHFNFEENGNILSAYHPTQDGKYYKFKFDNQIGAYCCIKCKEKKKIITATVCNGNDGKEFRLLNGVHSCVPFSK